MGHPKLSAEEARKRKKEYLRKLRKRPDAKQKRRETEKKRQAFYRAVGKSGDRVKKYRSDPVNYEREMVLQRERRARKRQNIHIGSDSKRTAPFTDAFVVTGCGLNIPYLISQSWDFRIKKNITSDLVQSVFPSHVDEGTFCSACMHYIKLGYVPPLALSNGFKFPNQPACLAALNDLEERLVSLCIPFMQIKECSYDRQLGIKGSIVNVPITLNQTVSTLPKNINDTATVHVKLKRSLKFKSNYMCHVINPKIVFEAASFLMKTPLYQSQELSLDSDWYEKFEKESFGPGNNCVVEMNSEGEIEIDWENDPFDNDEDCPNPAPVETVIQGDISTQI
ncbi:ATP-dependent DNA helicase [Trichonephila clavipes]|nr:ATP-dependent DNA helicase [Trichonephila clavipes]